MPRPENFAVATTAGLDGRPCQPGAIFDRQLEGITGRDVIVLPEMFTTGFAMEAAKQSLPEADVVEWMHARAAQSQCADCRQRCAAN